MSEFESMNEEQREFEQSLRQLQPAEPELDVAELMFRAGQDAARRESRRQLRRWQLSTLMTSACALVSASVLWSGTAATPANETSIAAETQTNQQASDVEVVRDDEPAIDEPDALSQSVADAEVNTTERRDSGEQPALLMDWWKRHFTVSVSSEESYIGLRNRVLRDGVDALPEPNLGGGSNTEEPLTSSPLRWRDALDQDLWNQI